jgi:undecaprenyl-diphosphatase
MQTTSILLGVMVVLISALLLIATVKKGVRPRVRSGIKGNLPWLFLLLFAMAMETGIHLLVPNPSYLLRMSAQTEILAGLSTWLQDTIPASIGPTFFSIIYFMGFAICIITLPLYLLAMGEDTIFKRYCLALSLASILLIIFQITVLSVRPNGPIYSDPFWGPIFVDLAAKGNSFPSGHAITVMAAAIAIWPLKRLRTVVLVLLLLIVVAVLYLEVHWPIDVIAGVALGVLCGLTANKLVEKWEAKRSRRSKPQSAAE